MFRFFYPITEILRTSIGINQKRIIYVIHIQAIIYSVIIVALFMLHKLRYK